MFAKFVQTGSKKSLVTRVTGGQPLYTSKQARLGRRVGNAAEPLPKSGSLANLVQGLYPIRYNAGNSSVRIAPAGPAPVHFAYVWHSSRNTGARVAPLSYPLSESRDAASGYITQRYTVNLSRILMTRHFGRWARGGAVATDQLDRWIFVYGFQKNERSDVGHRELIALRELARDLLASTEEELNGQAQAGILIEIGA